MGPGPRGYGHLIRWKMLPVFGDAFSVVCPPGLSNPLFSGLGRLEPDPAGERGGDLTPSPGPRGLDGFAPGAGNVFWRGKAAGRVEQVQSKSGRFSMSYDLNLVPALWDAESVRAWFAGRPNYDVQGNEIGYLNRDTGVYFSARLFDAPADADVEEGGPGAPFVAFNMNYARPHVFALEAEPEIGAFVEAFSCSVQDPQGAMGEGRWSPELFIAGWDAGNRFGYQVMTERGMEAGVRAAPGRIETAWRWNVARAAVQAAYNAGGRDVFTPMLMWTVAKSGGAVRTAATWTRGVATMIPAVAEAVILVRPGKPSLMSRITGNTGKLRADVALVPLAELVKAVDMEREPSPGGDVLVASGLNEVFDAAVRDFAFAGNPRAVFDAVPPDRMLDAEA